MEVLTQILAKINFIIGEIGYVFPSPIAIMPGWMSNTIISAVTGVLLLVVFKYTSNQTAIGKIRDSIKANLLAVKLYKDSFSVTIKSLGNVFKGAFLLLLYSAQPMLVMIVPVMLLLAQLGLWYQFKPIPVGQEALVYVTLKDEMTPSSPVVSLKPYSSYEVITGPVRVCSNKQIFWKIKIEESGRSDLIFDLGDQSFWKELITGDRFARINPKRPSMNLKDVWLYPAEEPFGKESPVQSIDIEYPPRDSFTSGSDYWVFFFFIVSMISALIFKPFFNVKI